jgi:hypothetical protein
MIDGNWAGPPGPPLPPHRYLIDGKRFETVHQPGGKVHVVRADDRTRLGCGRPVHGTRDHGDVSPQWLFEQMRDCDILCESCLAAVGRSLIDYQTAEGR